MGFLRQASRIIGEGFAKAHRDSFRRHCHILIQMGYECIRGEDHTASCEDDITMRLADAIRAYLSTGASPRWTIHYFVRDQIRQSSPATPARKRPQVDIEMESNNRGRPVYHFEAKRLRGTSACVDAYFGEDGLGCFLSGRYGADSSEGGMLGYIQHQSVDYWAQLLEQSLRESARLQLSRGHQWERQIIDDGPDHVFSTTHTRQGQGEIVICHSLLDFT